MRMILFALLLFSATNAQCVYPTGNTLNGSAQTFCVGNPTNSITINNVNSKNYTLINVVKGFTYTFSVGDVYSGSSEKLDIYNATSNSNIANASGSAGTSINNWVATYSGQIKLVLSRGSCSNSDTTNVSVTIQLVNVGNTQDNQNNFGTDTWVGHVYNWLGSPPPGGTSPSAPAATLPFDSASYVGYYTIPSESIVEGFGGDNNCLPIYSNGVVRTNIQTETFAVRYKMRSTRPAGCYIATIRGDDGIRLYNDGVLVFNSWIQQVATTYSNVLIYLDGSADLVFDFYENSGGNIAEFSLTPFNTNLNSITAPSNSIVCSGSQSGVIDGSSFVYNGSSVNPTIAFQWQSSTDNVTFTDIASATSEDYTPPAITTSTTIVRYYRRQVSAVSNTSACKFSSNSIAITTTGGTATTSPSANAGSGATCSQITTNWSAMVGASSYLLDVSTSSTFASFVSGYNGLNVGNVTSYIVTGLTANTTYYYRLRANYTCGLSSNSNPISYSTLAIVAPVATAATAISCGDFTANWNASPYATSYTIDVATSNTFTAGTIIAGYSGLNVGNVTSFNVSGTTESTLYYRISAVAACGNSSYSNVITVTTPTTTWNGTAWSNGVSSSSKIAIIDGNYNTATNGNFESCSLLVNNGYVLTIKSGNSVTIVNNLTNNGTINIENNGSLVQVNNSGVNSGNINMQRTAFIDFRDYVYWSSPVANFNSANISTYSNNNNLYKWIPTVVGNGVGNFGNWVNGTETMVIGKGYIERGLNNAPLNSPVNFTTTFVGVPNNGVLTTPISRGTYNTVGTYPSPYSPTNAAQDDDNWNLLGNPYPSAISANAFLTANSSNLDGFVKIWLHGIAPNTSASDPFYNNYGYNYDPNDYLTYNLSGPSIPGVFDGYIGSGQGFITRMSATSASTSANVIFNNSMRNKMYRNDQFYRNSNNNVNALSQGRIWIDLVSSTASSSTLIAYVDGATNGKDQMYDAEANLKTTFDIYSLLEGYDRNIIQGRSLPFDQNDQVPLAIKIPSNGNYTIAIKDVDGFFTEASQGIYLEDKLSNMIYDLRSSPYHFTSTIGEFTDRFVLRYTNQTLGNDPFEVLDNSVKIYVSDNSIVINSFVESIKTYEIYNVLGQTLVSKKQVKVNKAEDTSIQKSNQALIVKVTLENGKSITKKVIY